MTLGRCPLSIFCSRGTPPFACFACGLIRNLGILLLTVLSGNISRFCECVLALQRHLEPLHQLRGRERAQYLGFGDVTSQWKHGTRHVKAIKHTTH